MKKRKMTTRQKLELLKKIEQRNEQRRKDFKKKQKK